MDAVSAAGNFPVAALLGGGMEQPGIPCERNRDGPAILQANAQRVLIEAHVRHSLICCYRQNTHAKPPRAAADCSVRLIVTCSRRGRRNRGSGARDVNTLQSIVQSNQQRLLEAWHGYFGDSSR